MNDPDKRIDPPFDPFPSEMRERELDWYDRASSRRMRVSPKKEALDVSRAVSSTRPS